MVMSIEGGKQKTIKKHGSAITGTSVKQKSLTTSPQKEVKKAPDKLVTQTTQGYLFFCAREDDDNKNNDEVVQAAADKDVVTSSQYPHLTTSPVQD